VYGSQVGKGHKYPRVANPIRDREGASQGSSNDLMSRIKKLDVFATNTTSTKDSSPFKLPEISR